MFKLKTENAEISVKSYTENGGLVLYVPIDSNLSEIRNAVENNTELTFITVGDDGSEVMSDVMVGAFTLGAISMSDSSIKVTFKKTDSEIALLRAENALLREQITNIELALAELYEEMGA